MHPIDRNYDHNMMSSSEEDSASSASASAAHQRARRLIRRHTSIGGIEQTTTVPRVNMVSFVSGLAAGVAQAGLFNPFDRALYLSIKNDTKFLNPENFQGPYQGFFQSVGHRALSGGLYYPLEHFFITLLPAEAALDPGSPGAFYNFLAGMAAGSVNAIICNPISAIKYKTWGRDVNRGMVKESMEMLRKGGIRPFCNGLVPTVIRDLVFGGTYTFLRFELQYRLQLSSEYQWASNFMAAALATVVSGPFNLARNVQFATKSRHIAYTVKEVLTHFAQETSKRPTFYERSVYVQHRLRLGWGTARVALGMSFGHFVYDKLVGLYELSKSENNLPKR
jgi:hypothetical protein